MSRPIKITSKRTALEACLEMWRFLAKTGGDKSDFLKLENIKYEKTSCAACHYNLDVKERRSRTRDKIYCNETCIIQWVPESPRWNDGCTDSRAPYSKWCRAKTRRDRRKYARKVVKLVERSLGRLR